MSPVVALLVIAVLISFDPVFAARRAYALSAGSRLWFLLVLGLSLVPLGVNLVSVYEVNAVPATLLS